MKTNETSPAFSNPLKGSSSLYLRQHAQNPVMWYPWGSDAVALAKQQNKPILLSIGYSSCYWCHVMEREIFENVSIAAYMNQHFICIKADREEHPVLDETYMVARQLLTQQGGWPNNVFLTPELKPFYACGTMGLDESPNRPSFPRLLEWLHLKWINEQKTLQKEAEEINRLTTRFLKMREAADTQALSLAGLTHVLLDQLTAKHDDIRGGFFNAPKFPHETYLSYLLHIGEQFDHPSALNIAVNSLLKMAAGGIYDQVGCGFHRYAVDQNWYVPHFEKMLYNQAMCASAYITATRLTNNFYLGDVAQGTLEFVSAPMTSPFGAFYSSIDAETDAVEGAYYVWTPKEILEILSPEEAAFFQHYFALADIPHYPGHKAPNGQAVILRKPLWQSAQEEDLPYVQLAAMSGQVLNKLLNVRNQRPAPALDQKIITSWNGLMIKAYAEGYAQFINPKYKESAIAAARYFYMRYQESGKLHHTYDGYKSSADAALEDYAYLTQAVLSVHQHCGSQDIDWLDFARDLLKDSKARFFELKDKIYRLNQRNSLPDIAITHATDTTLPSAAASMLHANLMMYEITGDAHLKQHLKAVQPSYLAQISPAGALEYCELLTVYSKLALIEQDSDFKEEIAILLANAGEAQDVLKFSANISKGEQVKAYGVFHIEVEISLSEGWMIDAIAQDSEADSTTAIEVKGKNILEIQSIESPEPEVLRDESGLEKRVYRGATKLVLEVKCTAHKSRQPIEVRLNYQPCQQGMCYLGQQKIHRL